MTTDLFPATSQPSNKPNYPLDQQQLIALVRTNPNNGEAWWHLAQTFDDPQKRQDCLERAQRHGYAPPVATPEPEVILPWERADGDNRPNPVQLTSTPITPAIPLNSMAGAANYGAPAGAYQLPSAPPYPTLKPADLSQIVKILKTNLPREQQIRAVTAMFHCSPEHADTLLQGVAYHYPEQFRPVKRNSSKLVLEGASVVLGLLLMLIGGVLIFNPDNTGSRRWPIRLLLAGIFITLTASYRLFMLMRGNPET